MGELLLLLLFLGLASGLASTSIAQGKLFKPLRAKLAGKWIGDLIGCSFCLGHWFSLVLVFIKFVHPQFVEWWNLWTKTINFPELFLSALLYWLVVTAFSALTSGAISKLYE